MACGSCWFRHGEVQNDLHKNGSNTIKGMSELNVLDSRIAKMQATIEKRITELASYVDTRFAQIEAMIQESVMDEVAELSTRIDVLADTVIKNEQGELAKPDNGHAHDGIFEFNVKQAEDMKLEIESKLDEKLETFMKESVKCAFEAAFTSFAETMGERVVVIERGLEKLSKGVG